MSLYGENSGTENDQAEAINALIDSLRVRIWFNAVKTRSGLSNKALSRLFPSTQRKASESSPSSGTQYSQADSGYWHKIRRGEIMPLRRAHGQQLVENVEEAFPGTRRWIVSPLWDLLSTKPATTHDIYGILRSLHPRISEVLLVKSQVNSKFARRPPCRDQYQKLARIARPLFPVDEDDVFGRLMGGVVAVVALIREAEIIQQQPLHYQGRIAWNDMVSRLYHFPEIRPMLEDLKVVGINRFKGTLYSPDGEGGVTIDS